MRGHIAVISSGPGGAEWIPPAALAAMKEADLFLGYKTYLTQIQSLFPEKPRESSLMRQEKDRAVRAVQLAQAGQKVAVISGGDAGIFGMAGLILEETEALCPELLSEVEVLPGISALNAAAALLGAPLMTDFCAVSLSNYLIPLETILKRIEAAAGSGFILCIYNPKSQVRREPFERACKILQAILPADTPAAVVRAASRPNQSVRRMTLSRLPEAEIGMDCIVIIGNQTTKSIGPWLVTPRGYEI